jgi:hypothetical protein
MSGPDYWQQQQNELEQLEEEIENGTTYIDSWKLRNRQDFIPDEFESSKNAADSADKEKPSFQIKGMEAAQ